MLRFFSLAGVVLALLVGCKASSNEVTPTTVGGEITPTTVIGETTQTAVAEPSATPEPAATTERKTIEVLGDDSFKEWTERAMALLESEAPEAYEAVLESIDVIESVAAGSGMYVAEKRFAVGEQTAFAPGYDESAQLVWYAGSIVHNANHSAQYARGDPHTGKEAEVECLTVQLAAMQLLTDDAFFPGYLQGLIDGADDPVNQYWNQPNRHW